MRDGENVDSLRLSPIDEAIRKTSDDITAIPAKGRANVWMGRYNIGRGAHSRYESGAQTDTLAVVAACRSTKFSSCVWIVLILHGPRRYRRRFALNSASSSA